MEPDRPQPFPAEQPAQQPTSQPDQIRQEVGEQAAGVGDDARSEATAVATQAQEQASAVMHRAYDEVGDVLDEARRAVHDEADKQTRSLSTSLHHLARDLSSMAGRSEGETQASDYVARAGRSLDQVAERLDEGGIDGALDEVRTIARRHPGMFLAGAALAGYSTARVLRHASAPDLGNGSAGTATAGTQDTESESIIDLRGDAQGAPPVGGIPGETVGTGGRRP